MIITNKTNVDIFVDNVFIKPNMETEHYEEKCIDVLNIHSEIGSCVITIMCKKINIKNFGKLVVEEVKKDESGRRNIIISSIE